MEHEIPGYAVPLSRSLTTPLLLAGAPRAMAILNGTLTAALGLGLHCLYAIPLGVVVHVAASSIPYVSEDPISNPPRRWNRWPWHGASTMCSSA